MVQGWFNVQSAGSYAGLLPNSVSESANLTVPAEVRATLLQLSQRVEAIEAELRPADDT